MTAGKVSFQIGGRKYTVACEAGQEDDVATLAAVVDGKLDQLGGNLAPQDAQNLLMAALFLADDLREAKAVAEQAAGHEGRAQELSDRIAQLEAASQVGAQDIEAVREEAGEQRARAERAEAAASTAPSPPPAADDPNLAPALERFAQMLEECADKLEGKAPSA